MIIALHIAGDQGGILRLHQFFDQRQIIYLGRGQAVPGQKTGQLAIWIEDVGALVGTVKLAVAQALEQRQRLDAGQQAR